jgi:hypothetical protein
MAADAPTRAWSATSGWPLRFAANPKRLTLNVSQRSWEQHHRERLAFLLPGGEARAHLLAHIFRAARIECVVDWQLRAAQPLETGLRKMIRKCDPLVVLLTRASLNSAWTNQRAYVVRPVLGSKRNDQPLQSRYWLMPDAALTPCAP